MAEEIRIACQLSPHTTTDANAYYGRIVMTNNAHQAFGIIVPDDKDSRINFRMASPIPTNINGTPAGILRVFWGAAGTGNFKVFADVLVATNDTTSLDPTVGTLSTSVTEAVAVGANTFQATDISLTSLAASLTNGKTLFGWLGRKANTDAADTVEAAIVLLGACFVANT